jgi:light-regulated signal transduction histidine kinase (bacteriophytochrome)
VDGANRMKSLISDLLTYSRVSTRTRPFADVDLGDVLRRVLASLERSVKECGATLTVGPLPQVHGDVEQIALLFTTLLTNALKFQAPDAPPRIHISARLEQDTWAVSIQDNGIGIEPQYFERIFAIFQRLHPPNMYPGTGIGLAIARKIAERHRGRIWVESTPGQGATFTFTLPGTGT